MLTRYVPGQLHMQDNFISQGARQPCFASGDAIELWLSPAEGRLFLGFNSNSLFLF